MQIALGLTVHRNHTDLNLKL